jgi:hypothetical protein
MSGWEVLLVSLGTFIVGYVFSFLSERSRSKSAKQDRGEERMDRQKDREAERDALLARLRAKRAARHLENQLAWLVELQEILSDFMRAFGEIEHADIIAVRSSGQEKMRVPLLDEELSDRANVLQRRAIVLASRVDAEEVRTGVQELMGHYSFYGVRAEVAISDITDRGSIVSASFYTNIQAIGLSLRNLAPIAGE